MITNLSEIPYTMPEKLLNGFPSCLTTMYVAGTSGM